MKTISGNIFLIGLMGAGKTTLGKQIATKLKLDFFDSDHEICHRTGVSVATIFELEGETGFRNREISVIDELTDRKNIVLATGGGAITRKENCDNLKNRGTVIYLHATPNILLSRTRNDSNRPLLQVQNPLLKLQELYEARDQLYRQIAHITVESNRYGKYKIIEQILKALQQKR